MQVWMPTKLITISSSSEAEVFTGLPVTQPMESKH